MKKTEPKHVQATDKVEIPIRCAHNQVVDPMTLQPHPQNPKRHGPRKLELYGKIIREAGWRRAVVVSNQSGFIISGHGATLAAIQLGCLVPVDRQDFPSLEAEKAAMLADNWLAESLADYDQDLLAQLADDLRTAGMDTELAGFLRAFDDDAPLLRKVEVPPAPRMAWVLIGIPTTRFGQINKHVEAIARVDGVRIETTANDSVE